MNDLLPFIVTGLVSGSLYGLAGMGLVLTYRTSGVFNFGHGAIAAAAAYVFYTLHVTHGVPWPVAATATVALFATVVGILMERLTSTLADAPQVVSVVATVGVLLGVQGLLLILYGDAVRFFPSFLPDSGVQVVGVNVSWGQVITVSFASSAALGLYAFMRRSRLGVGMRAVVDNPVLVGLAGQHAPRIRRTAWSVGCGFAALTGILVAPTVNLDATLLTLLVVQALGACAIGRFTSLPLTYVGGLVIGIVAAVSTKYFTEQPLSGIPSSVPFIVLIVALLVVPRARLPQQRVGMRDLVTELSAISARARLLGLGLCGVGGLLVPVVVPGPKLPLWIGALVYLVLFTSLSLLVWTSGQISLCHAAFAAIGASGFAQLSGNGVPWALSLLLAGLLAVPVGAIVAVPAARLSGIYLALVTLGFNILLQNAVFSSSWMFGPGLIVNAPRPQLGPLDGRHDVWLYYLYLGIAAVSLGVLVALQRSRLGRVLRALSQSPTMLVTHGLSVNTTRVLVFSVSGFFAALSGGLAVSQSGAVSGAAYGPLQSLTFVAVLAICGTRLLRSSALAALALAVVPGYATDFGVNQQLLIFGFLATVAAAGFSRRDQLADWLHRAAETSVDRTVRGPASSHRRARPATSVSVATSGTGGGP